MSQVDQALQTLTTWGRAALAVLLDVFSVIDHSLRGLLSQAGVPPAVQSLVILAAAVVFIVAVLRLFGGVLRVLLIVFLILLIVHVLVPNAGL